MIIHAHSFGYNDPPSCSSNNLATAILIAVSSNYVVSRKLADNSNLTTMRLSYVYQNQHAENTFTFILKLLSCINCLVSVLVLILVYRHIASYLHAVNDGHDVTSIYLSIL